MVKNSHSEPDESFAVTPIEDGAKRSWTVGINGEDATDATKSATLTNESLGLELRFGMRPEGYDGFIIREEGGGGAATIPYMITSEGGIYVGVVEENRATLGGITQNIPRGMQSKGETHEQTAARELAEETGYTAQLGRFSLLASGLNSNSAFFDTSRSPNDGISMYALNVKEDELDLTHDDKGNVYYQFSQDVNDNTAPDITEKIMGSRVIPLEAALKSRDMFTAAAAGHLLADLLSKGEYLVPQNKSVQPISEHS
jgi:8-oxo-dGTP pyrophosphatase MutT (NUDIX family)